MAGKRSRRISVALAMALASALMLVTVASATGPIAHKVSAGGPDACGGIGLKPGCDANFSLTGIQYADGSAKGEYTDILRFGAQKGDGFHAVIDCVSVVGNQAWVSGVITHGTVNGFDLAGLPVATTVKDNGTSSNEPADQISSSSIGDPTPCTVHVAYALMDAPQGQVTVR